MPDRISVVIPARDGATTLPEAIGSVRAQGWTDLEVLVVDDGSTDDTAAVGRRLGARVISQANAGPSAARNAGIAASTGDGIAFLDVDDALCPDALVHLVAALAPGVDAVRGAVQQQVRRDGAWVDTGGHGPLALTGGALFRRAAFERIGGFDPTLRTGEDLDWWARASDAGLNVRQIPAVTLWHRRHATNVTRDRERLTEDLLTVLRRRVRR